MRWLGGGGVFTNIVIRRHLNVSLKLHTFNLNNTIRKEKISQLVEQIKRKSKKMDKKRKKVKVSTPKVSMYQNQFL